MKYIKTNILLILILALLSGCDNEIDNEFRRHEFNMELDVSEEVVFLQENKENEVALTINWTPAFDRGINYNTTYLYEVFFYGESQNSEPIKAFLDDDNLTIKYTHKELQDLLVEYWHQKPGRTVALQFIITATFEGSTIVIPEIASSIVKFHMYGPKQFEAEELFASGTAVNDELLNIPSSNANNTEFSIVTELKEGKVNFPISFGLDDKLNAIAPDGMDQSVDVDNPAPMKAIVTSIENAKSWIIPEDDRYKITIDFVNEEVSIVPAGSIVEADNILIDGTAIGGETNMIQTLEDENCYAFLGTLSPGTLYLPLVQDGDTFYSIVPEEDDGNELKDGVTVSFVQEQTTTAINSRHWIIPKEDTYRVVVNLENKEITIYSSETDLKPMIKTWNNTVIGQNPYSEAVTKLWMYGSFNNFDSDGNGFTGFNDKNMLQPSLANPNIFVYHGDVLPRTSRTDDYGVTVTGALNFKVSNIHNNVYAFGSTADAVRGQYNGYVQPKPGETVQMTEGQGHNRYAFFEIPENTNLIIVDIENMTVIFDNRELSDD